MQPSGRLAAAIEVLDEIQTRHRPASATLRDWGRAHRFAGSGDRAAIGNIVFDALRHKASLAWMMGSEDGRALALGVMAMIWREDPEKLCDGSRFAPPGLNEEERNRLSQPSLQEAPAWVVGNYPEWLQPSLEAALGDKTLDTMTAMSKRAPVDLRVNTLKADRDKVLKALKRFGAKPTPWSPVGIRIDPPGKDGRSPHIEADTAHGKGWFEVQDEGSQLAGLIAAVQPGMQVCDLCAGAGGKTLALAAIMRNSGQIYAYDQDGHRLRPIFERMRRAGVRNVQVLGAEQQELADITRRMDVVFVDAPCSGSGAWRRKPDAKWRFSNNSLQTRINEQHEVLEQGAALVKPGGRLVYVTCSLLAEENQQQVEWFLAKNSNFSVVPVSDLAADVEGFPCKAPWISGQKFMSLSPAISGTDGFFACVLQSHAN